MKYASNSHGYDGYDPSGYSQSVESQLGDDGSHRRTSGKGLPLIPNSSFTALTDGTFDVIQHLTSGVII